MACAASESGRVALATCPRAVFKFSPHLWRSHKCQSAVTHPTMQGQGMRNPTITHQEFNSLVTNCIGPSTVMLAIAQGRDLRAEDVISNGTGSLVNTGGGEFLVTNDHLYESFRSHREEDSSTRLLMSGAHGANFLDISQALVRGRDEGLDLAVLHVPSTDEYRQGRWFAICSPWPPRRPEVGMLATIYGYPGEGRMPQGGVLGARAVVVALPVASVSDRHFIVVDENDDSIRLTPEGAEPLTSFGGLSGSAVYVMTRETATSKAEMFLGGFVYEASGSRALCVAHADWINADGTIR